MQLVAQHLGRRVLLALTLVLPIAATLPGCGGGGSGEASFSEQYQDALKVTDAGIRSRKLAALASKQKAAGDILGAEQTISAAGEAARSVAEPLSRATNLANVAGAAGKLEMSTDKIKSLLKEAAAAASEIPDADAQIPALTDLAVKTSTYLKNPDAAAEYLLKAEDVAAKLGDNLTRSIAASKIGASYGKIERSDDAMRVFNAMLEVVRPISDPRERADCLSELGAGLAAGNQTEMATTVLGEAKTAAGEIGDDETSVDSKAYAYLRLSQKMKAAKLTAEADQALAEAEKLAEKVKSQSIRSVLQEEIAASKKSS